MAVSPFAWRPCCLRTIQRPLAASPCSRLPRPRSTISQSDCRLAFGPFSPFRLGGSYKLSLERDLPNRSGAASRHGHGLGRVLALAPNLPVTRLRSLDFVEGRGQRTLRFHSA